MTGPQHYKLAAQLLDAVAQKQVTEPGAIELTVQTAQAHATLALAAATAYPAIRDYLGSDDQSGRQWTQVA